MGGRDGQVWEWKRDRRLGMWRVWFLRELLRFLGDMAIGIAAVPTVCEDLEVGVRGVAWWSLHSVLGCHDPTSAFQCHVPL